MTYYIRNETPEQQRARFAKERADFIAKLVDLQLAIIAMRNHVKFTRGDLDLEVPEYRALLEAVYAVTEIDAVWEAAQELPEYPCGEPDKPFAAHEYVRVTR